MNKYLILAGLLASNVAFGDAYTGKEDIKPDGKHSTVYNIERLGALLPSKTYTGVEEGAIQPRWWNGYGVEPIGPAYYYYLDRKFEGRFDCAEGYREIWDDGRCAVEQDREEDKLKEVPTPPVWMYIGVGLVYFTRYKVKPGKLFDY